MDETRYSVDLLCQGRRITAPKNERLLETLVIHNILLRSDCGGKGVCGKCRVEQVGRKGKITEVKACTLRINEDMVIRIPDGSLLSSYTIKKPPAPLPESFTSTADESSAESGLGIAVDLGTTTIAVYLCDIRSRKVLSTVAAKNPQALYGDDVMSRIGCIGQSVEKLGRLQQLVVHSIEWAVKELFSHSAANTADLDELVRMIVVGNPTMIHILLGVNPSPIGISPYQPVFSEARQTAASSLGFDLPNVTVHTLDQISGFIGGDILSATLATELQNQPVGTLLIDLGTNGELVLKGKDTFFTTSCATGPVFEGAALSCGCQALPGAIDQVVLAGPEGVPEYRVIKKEEGDESMPSGLCGTGVVSSVAALLRTGIVEPSGLLTASPYTREQEVQNPASGAKRYVIVPAGKSATGKDISISQKDIRSVQLGKAALITGIEFLLRAADLEMPEKILIAGAFGTYLNKADMLVLGMLPLIDPARIHVAGNSAGAGAIMALCNKQSFEKVRKLAVGISVIELAGNIDFQNTFVKQLSFPQIVPVA